VLGSIRAGLEFAFIETNCVLVGVVMVHLLLGRPAILMMLACLDWAFPWAGVSFLVFGQVVGAPEFFVTSRFTADAY
jgi:hypothetical protein